jgi:hypothetical protein
MGGFPPSMLLTTFEEDRFAGVAKRPDYWPLGDYFHRTRKAPK